MNDGVEKVVSLEELERLETGTGIYFEVNDVSVKSSFVGSVKGTNVVVTPPKLDGPIEDAFLEKVFIKFVSEGDMYQFKTSLQRTVKDPLPLLVFEYPEKLVKKERRAVKRTKCFVPVKGLLQDQIKDGIIRDISMKGCRCNFFVSGNDGIDAEKVKSIILKCQFSKEEKEQEITGEVKFFTISGNILSVGMMFHDVSDDSKRILNDYIMTIESEKSN